jgi:hypothetical protein
MCCSPGTVTMSVNLQWCLVDIIWWALGSEILVSVEQRGSHSECRA